MSEEPHPEDALILEQPREPLRAILAFAASAFMAAVPVFVLTKWRPTDLGGWLFFSPFLLLLALALGVAALGLQLLTARRWELHREGEWRESQSLWSERRRPLRAPGQDGQLALVRCRKVRDEQLLDERWELRWTPEGAERPEVWTFPQARAPEARAAAERLRGWLGTLEEREEDE